MSKSLDDWIADETAELRAAMGVEIGRLRAELAHTIEHVDSLRIGRNELCRALEEIRDHWMDPLPIPTPLPDIIRAWRIENAYLRKVAAEALAALSDPPTEPNCEADK